MLLDCVFLPRLVVAVRLLWFELRVSWPSRRGLLIIIPINQKYRAPYGVETKDRLKGKVEKDQT